MPGGLDCSPDLGTQCAGTGDGATGTAGAAIGTGLELLAPVSAGECERLRGDLVLFSSSDVCSWRSFFFFLSFLDFWSFFRLSSVRAADEELTEEESSSDDSLLEVELCRRFLCRR